MPRLSKIIILIGALVIMSSMATIARSQQTPDEIAEFNTDSGKCGRSELTLLNKTTIGFSYTIDAEEIRTSDGANPQLTKTTIPSITGVTCHAIGREDKLVLISRKDKPSYCGWIPVKSLLQSKSKRSNRSSGEVFFGNDDKPKEICGDITPLTITEYCQRMEQFGVSPETCADPKIGSSTIKTKFLVWNAALSPDQRKANALEVPKYRTSKADEEWGSLDVFAVLNVYDVASNKKGTFYLVGQSAQKMFGWVHQDSGTTWYTRLATFFAKGSTGRIFTDLPWLDDSLVISEVPSNLDAMLKGEKEFAQYPVVFDRRERPKKDAPDGWVPHLEIAFIGRYCKKDQLCTENGEQVSSTIPDFLRKADVMFVIDATKSMKEYFGLVSRAIRDVTNGVPEIKGTPDYRFGLVMYGDYINKNAQGLNDRIQYRQEIALGSLRKGNEFDNLASAKLYIDDPSGGYPEAPYAALAKTIRETRWRDDNRPKLIIHIADHGDRGPPPAELVQLMQQNTIFYMPIAVRGNFRPQENGDFVRQSQNILNAHVVAGTNTSIGLETVQKTYSDAGVNSAIDADYEKITGAIEASIFQHRKLSKLVLRKLLNEETGGAEGGNQEQRDGFSSLTDAFLSVYNIKISAGKNNQKNRTLAAKGYIQIAQAGDNDRQWTHSIYLQPGDLRSLIESFENLCTNIFETGAQDNFADTLKVIIAKLTGDNVENKDFFDYFDSRDSIPLSSQTILGEGILKLGRDMGDPNGAETIRALQKEICRTHALLQMIDAKQKIDHAFEGTRNINGVEVAGDMEWNQNNSTYSVKNKRDHIWISTDALGGRILNIPLDFLPGLPESIN